MINAEQHRRERYESLMDELCKRHTDAFGNGTIAKFRITSIYEQYFAGFDRSFVDKVLQEYLKEGIIFINSDTVELTKTGKQFCSNKKD
jgi:predicted transcriptional regulator